MDLSRAKLVHPGIAGRKESKEELFDRGSSTPVILVSREEKVFTCPPLLDLVGTGSYGLAVVFGKGVQVLPLENMPGKGAPPELVLIGRVDPPVGDDGGEIVGSRDRLDEVEALGRFRVVGRVVDGLDGEGDVLGCERLTVLPAHSGSELPGDLEAPVVENAHQPVLGSGNHLGEDGHRFHLLVPYREPLGDADHRVLEDVSREAVEGIGLAIVADDQELVRGRRGLPGSRARESEQEKHRGSS